jgi:hypothetical protein
MIRSIRHIAIFWLLLIGGSQLMASDGDTAFLRNTRKIDVCDDAKKSVIITLDIGEITRSDSLYGYNFRIDFDSLKIDFHTFLDLNTLSEYFEYKGANFFNSDGYVEGYAVNLTGAPVSGNRPLFGLFGNYLGDCPDTTYVSINYIDFTDEFMKEYKVFMDAEIIASVEDKQDRFLRVSFEDDTVKSFNNDMQAEALISLETNPGLRLESAMFELSVTNSDLYDIEDIELVADNMMISELTKDNSKISFRAFFNEDFNEQMAFKAKLTQLEKTFETAELEVRIFDVNECSCITRLFDDKVIIKGIEQDTSTSVNDFVESDVNSYYNVNEETFVIEANDLQIDRLKCMTLME